MMEQIGPYRIEEQIGVGGMGEVYKAYDDRLDRWVAIKRIRSDKDDEGGESRERFQREARATARLSHSSIVHLYDIFQDGNSDCIVMEFVEGITLDKLIRNGPLESVQAASLGQEIANGLAEAHTKGIIHRDLKVENVIVTPDGHAKILDFGLARPLLAGDLDTSLTGKGQLVGTSRAMSPEQAQGFRVDSRSDLFSLGTLYYETFTALSPFKGTNHLDTLDRVCNYQQPSVRDCDSALPRKLSALIDRLLEKNPARRPQSADEVVVSLDGVKTDERDVSDTVPVVVDGKIPERPSSRREAWRPAAPLDETTQLGRPRPPGSREDGGGKGKPFWRRLTLPATLTNLWRRATGSRQENRMAAVDSRSSKGRSPRVASS